MKQLDLAHSFLKKIERNKARRDSSLDSQADGVLDKSLLILFKVLLIFPKILVIS